jgi:glycosyltransferase involved in cell wall biosynthesis
MAYNEKNNIEETFDLSLKIKEKFKEKVGIYFLDDGSTDGTMEILEKKFSNSETLILNKINKGIDYNEKDIFPKLKGEYVLGLPCDNRFTFVDIDHFLVHILKNLTFNIFVLSPERDNRKILRRLASKLVALATNIVLNKKIKFYNLALVCLKREYFKIYPSKPQKFASTIFYRSIVNLSIDKTDFFYMNLQKEEDFRIKDLKNLLHRAPSICKALFYYPRHIKNNLTKAFK